MAILNKKRVVPAEVMQLAVRNCILQRPRILPVFKLMVCAAREHPFFQRPRVEIVLQDETPHPSIRYLRIFPRFPR